ncbi:MAG: type II toxin-antitoxin system MqsR family toxin [Candidatus Weimeria sp.]
MDGKASRDDITEYLARVKKLASSGEFDFVPRRKNLQSLAKHGLLPVDVKDEIIDLVVENYYKGPKQDYDPNRPGDIWEFIKKVDGVRFYIKLKIVHEKGSDILKCLSFHED